MALAGFLLLISPVLRAQEAPDPPNPTPEPDPPPTIFPHPETDRLWISGQANFISQWPPAFHSPYQGPNSLPPQAQDATSRVLTLFNAVRLSGTNELICDGQESGGTGVGARIGVSGAGDSTGICHGRT